MTSIPRLLSVVTLFGVWFLLSMVLPETIVPAPVDVVATVGKNVASGDVARHLSITLSRVVLGLVVAMVLGTTVGLVMGLSRSGEVFFDSWVTVGLTVPAIVYGMICLLWFGLNDVAAVIAIGINMWQGAKSIDKDLLEMGEVFRLGRVSIVRKIVLPQLLPFLLASLRFALGICWKICTTVELIGLSSGVGYMLHYWFGLFSMTQVFAWTLTFLIVMLFIEHGILKPLEKRLLVWRPVVQV
jgi:NitT/TauT family transport system permease protein